MFGPWRLKANFGEDRDWDGALLLETVRRGLDVKPGSETDGNKGRGVFETRAVIDGLWCDRTLLEEME